MRHDLERSNGVKRFQIQRQHAPNAVRDQRVDDSETALAHDARSMEQRATKRKAVVMGALPAYGSLPQMRTPSLSRTTLEVVW